MACADVVLPACTYPEARRPASGRRPAARRGHQQGRARSASAKSDAEINLLLGKRLNPEAWPWDSVEDMFTAMIATTGMHVPRAARRRPRSTSRSSTSSYEKGLLRADGKPGFNTAHRPHRAVVHVLQPAPASTRCRTSTSPNARPGSDAGRLMDEYPLRADHRRPPLDVLPLGASPGRPPAAAWTPGPASRFIPTRAAELGFVADGEWVWVENHVRDAPSERVKDHARSSTRAWCPADHGWWLPGARSREPLRRLRRQHQQPGSDVLRQVRLRRQLQDLESVQAVQGSGRASKTMAAYGLLVDYRVVFGLPYVRDGVRRCSNGLPVRASAGVVGERGRALGDSGPRTVDWQLAYQPALTNQCDRLRRTRDR